MSFENFSAFVIYLALQTRVFIFFAFKTFFANVFAFLIEEFQATDFIGSTNFENFFVTS